MTVLIKQATIVAPSSDLNGLKKDLLIENGSISRVADSLDAPGATVIKSDNLHVSIGWFDMHANFRDPGFEYKEDLDSGMAVAANGGFTGVACMPSTEPAIDTKSGVDYIRNKTKGNLVDVHVIGAISKGRKGVDLAEMFDMHKAGAKAFSDDKNSIANADLLKRALLYSKGFDGLIIHFAQDNSIAHDGMMHEGKVSTGLGLKGLPSLAEEVMLARDLFLLEYTDARLHFSTVSTAGGVELIRQAKKKGLQVTAEVAAHNLVLDDSYLEQFDANYKVMPPLRGRVDQEALTEGLRDGTIDAICSDHNPENEENKKCELDHAEFGMTGQETCYAAVNTHLGKQLTTEILVSSLALRPRQILGLETPTISEGTPANLTLFDPDIEWEYNTSVSFSKSHNSPFLGKTLKGKVVAVLNNGQLALTN